MFASLALEQPALSPDLRSDLQTILGETRRCGDIVRRLLEFSRESPPHKEWSAINRLLDQTLALLEHQALFQDVRILRRYRDDLPETLLDPNQIEQVLMNIMLNAGQAMGGQGELELATGCGGGWLQVGIRDTGCGIPEENLKKIFDPFFTTKEHFGTGLGLSVSYGIIQNHGGTIEVTSKVGSGTLFTIRLPIHTSEEPVT